MTTLENAVAVVTGAGRGIGRAIAEELGRGGARVVVNYSRSKGPAEELIEQLMEQGSPQAVAIQADVADAAQAARLIQETAQQFGRFDVLVNNAGINIDRSMKNLSVEEESQRGRLEHRHPGGLEQLLLHRQSRAALLPAAEQRQDHQH